MMPRRPRRKQINIPRHICRCCLLLLFLIRTLLLLLQLKRRQRLDSLFHQRLSVHGHVNQKGQVTPNRQGFLHCARILRQSLIASITGRIPARPSDDDAPHAAKVGIVDLEVQHLARNASNQGICRAQVDPGANVCCVGIDRRRGKQARVIRSQRRDNGVSSRTGVGAGGRFCELFQKREVV